MQLSGKVLQVSKDILLEKSGAFFIAIASNKSTTRKLLPACGSFSGKAATKMPTPLCPEHFQQNLVCIKQAKLLARKQAAREAPRHSSLPQSCSTTVTTRGKLTPTCKHLGGQDTKQCFQQLFFFPPLYLHLPGSRFKEGAEG